MASIPITGAPAAPAPTAPAHEPWPDDDPVSIRADELFARRLDTEFSAGVRGLLHDPEAGLSSLTGEAALEAVAGIYPALEALKQPTLADAVGPRQKALLQPLIDTRLDWAAGTIGRLAERATVEVDDQSVAERLTGLRQDAEASWHDLAHLRTLGRAAVGELRWQGERRGWDDAETDARTRGGLSDLYAGAVEAAMGRDLDVAASLLAHAREVIEPARLQAIDDRLVRAREDSFLREVDAALSALPLDPAAPPSLEAFSEHVAGLTPSDATEEVRGRFAELAVHAQRRAERRWQKLQSEAGAAALDWFRQNPDSSSLFLPEEMRAWLASDQVDGLKALEEHGRLVTAPDLFERLDRQLVYEPEAFATLDLDRHRLSLDDDDHARFASVQKAIVEGEIDPAFARYRLARLGIDHALEQRDSDGDGPEAAGARADMRHLLDAFEAIEGRPTTLADIDAIVAHTLGEAADGAIVRQPSEPFDPHHVVPTGRPPRRPPAQQPPGPSRNTPTDPTQQPPRLPEPTEFKRRIPGQSGKEAKDEIPEWARQRGARPGKDEDGKTAAQRYMDEKYGLGQWEDRGPRSEFNRLKKFFDSAFE